MQLELVAINMICMNNNNDDDSRAVYVELDLLM